MNHLKESIIYSLNFIPLLIEKADREMIAEPLLQLFRDLYQYRLDKEPYYSVQKLVEELDITLSGESVRVLALIEESQRKQKDYAEAMATVRLEDLQLILDQVKAYLSDVEASG